MLSMISRGRIKDAAVVQEFEHLIGRLRGFLSQSFDADGELIVADPSIAVFSVGDYKFSARIVDHPGWLIADGRQVSRTTYKLLFDEVGTTYGVGDGSTTFNIPNMVGRFPLGKTAAGTGSSMGAVGGNIDHTHTGPSHTHSITASGALSTNDESAHTHSVSGITDTTGTSNNTAAGTDFGSAPPAHVHVFSTTSGAGSAHSHTIDTHNHGGGATGAEGTGNTGTANPPFLAGNYFVYVGV